MNGFKIYIYSWGKKLARGDETERASIVLDMDQDVKARGINYLNVMSNDKAKGNNSTCNGKKTNVKGKT